MSNYPTSPNDTTRGIIYFPRMLDKIRMHARGELPQEYHKNLGGPRTADGACCNFLRVKYNDCASECFKAVPTKKFWSGVSRKGAGLTKGIFSCGIISLPNSAGEISPPPSSNKRNRKLESPTATISRRSQTSLISKKAAENKDRHVDRESPLVDRTQ